MLHLCLLVLFASDVELFNTERALARAFRDRNPVELAAGFRQCAAENSLDGLQIMLKYYGPTEDIQDESSFTGEDHFNLFSICARAVAQLTDREAVVALPRLAVSWKHWAGRLVLVAGCRANPKVDAVKLSLEVLEKERHPLVVAEAVKTLGGSKQKKVILPLIDYWEKLEKRMRSTSPTHRPSGRRAGSSMTSYRSPEWERVPFIIQQALMRLCGRICHSPTLYRSYYTSHKDRIDPTKPVKIQSEGRTVLFGMELVGKNIAFVLDISGSMRTTDPLPRGERVGPRTRIKGSKEDLFPDEDRMRIVRAKKELTRVVRALPTDKSFNIIAYSSDINAWKNHLVPVTSEQKKSAKQFIEDLSARGITITDYALEHAFQDPIVDTIYLISDGAPTHRGSMGPGLPPDSKQLMKEIIRRMKVLNYRRSVRIFTLGFPGSQESFMKQLAEDHGGTYRPIK